MIRTTFPVVRQAWRKNGLSIAGILLLAVFLGLIPTIKSELEAGVLEAASQSSSVSESGDVARG